jgi:hypothetical protein
MYESSLTATSPYHLGIISKFIDDKNKSLARDIKIDLNFTVYDAKRSHYYDENCMFSFNIQLSLIIIDSLLYMVNITSFKISVYAPTECPGTPSVMASIATWH